MLAFRLRWAAAAALVGVGTVGAIAACGGKEFTLTPGAGDGGSGDGRAGDDGGPGPDALVEAEAGDPGFCADLPAPKPFLCDDFDHHGFDVKGPIWDDFKTSPFSDGQIDSRVFLSSPRSFVVNTLHAGLMNDEVPALLSKAIGRAKTVAMSYDIMVDTYGSDGGATDAPPFVTLVQLDTLSYALVIVSPTQSSLLEIVTPPDGGTITGMGHPITAGFPASQWTHVDMLLNLPQGTSPGSATVAYDKMQVLTTPLFPAPVPPPPGAIGAVSIGLYFKGAAPQIWRINYDNVIIQRGL